MPRALAAQTQAARAHLLRLGLHSLRLGRRLGLGCLRSAARPRVKRGATRRCRPGAPARRPRAAPPGCSRQRRTLVAVVFFSPAGFCGAQQGPVSAGPWDAAAQDRRGVAEARVNAPSPWASSAWPPGASSRRPAARGGPRCETPARPPNNSCCGRWRRAPAGAPRGQQQGQAASGAWPGTNAAQGLPGAQGPGGTGGLFLPGPPSPPSAP